MSRVAGRRVAVLYGSSRPKAVLGDLLRILPAGLPWIAGFRRTTWASLWPPLEQRSLQPSNSTFGVSEKAFARFDSLWSNVANPEAR